MRENQWRLEDVKTRCRRATPGPWVPREESFVETGTDTPHIVCVTCRRDPDEVQELPAAENAEFIAHARTDVPRLVQEVERLRAALEKIADRQVRDPARVARQALDNPDTSRGASYSPPRRADSRVVHALAADSRSGLVIDVNAVLG